MSRFGTLLKAITSRKPVPTVPHKTASVGQDNSKPPLRVGFMNLWKEAAEYQAYQSVAEAARRCGHELIHVSNTDEALAANLDFMLSVTPAMEKLTSIPTFANLHLPRSWFWENESHFQSLLTYDGYLTLSDNLVQFAQSLCAGLGRRDAVGVFYPTAQSSEIRANIETSAANGTLSIAYFGTNWDKRNRPLFRSLAEKQITSLFGPPHSWSYLNSNAYKGQLPFDGAAVQAKYAECGVGLVVQSQTHMLDDIISNRIFEITSVGALAICPDMPWIRKHFGHSVRYYPAFADAQTISNTISDIWHEIREDPRAAAEAATHARTIFEDRFCAEIMFRNAVDYYRGWRDDAERRIAQLPRSTIDVIVRLGDHPEDLVLRTLASIDEQTAGSYRVILVRCADVDVSALTTRQWRRIHAVKIVDTLSSAPAYALTVGVRAVEAGLFAILDVGDFLLSNHFETLFEAAQFCDPDRAFVYSGVIEHDDGPEAELPTSGERRRIRRLEPAQGDIMQILGAIGVNTFLAASKLLRDVHLDGWRMTTAEDKALIGALLRNADVRFTYRATACVTLGAHAPARPTDLMDVALRIGSGMDAIEQRFASPQTSLWERLGKLHRDVVAGESGGLMNREETIAFEDGALVSTLEQQNPVLIEVPLNSDELVLNGNSRFEAGHAGGRLLVMPLKQSWADGLRIDVKTLASPEVTHLVATFDAPSSEFGFSTLDAEGAGFLWRCRCVASDKQVEIWVRADGFAQSAGLVIQSRERVISQPLVLKRLTLVLRR